MKKLVKMTISEEEFRDLVMNQRMNDRAIAKQLGVCAVTVQHWRRRFNLASPYTNRPRRERKATRPRRKLYATAEELRALYVDQALPQKAIAAKYGVNQMTISNWLFKYGIKCRPQGGRLRVMLPEADVRRLYHDEKWTMEAMAKHFKCGESTIRQNLIRHDLQIDPKENVRRRLQRNQTQYPQQMEHRGYREIRKPNHPFVDQRGYVQEHRLVAESAIGRYLNPGEQVHHINLKKRDNRAENLAVLPSKSTHAEIHNYMQRCFVFLTGLTTVRPEPLVFERPVFWGGKYITQLDLVRGAPLDFLGHDDLLESAAARPLVN